MASFPCVLLTRFATFEDLRDTKQCEEVKPALRAARAWHMKSDDSFASHRAPPGDPRSTPCAS